MKKMFFSLVAVLPFFAGCWPFSKKEEAKHEMTEVITPAAEESASPSEENMTEESAQDESEAESDEK
jgi:hypothetical protein